MFMIIINMLESMKYSRLASKMFISDRVFGMYKQQIVRFLL